MAAKKKEKETVGEGSEREWTLIAAEKLEPNRGQLYGLPKNPRFIKDERFEALKKSLAETPEMMKLRPLLVYPLENGNYVVVGGNMRLRACMELKWTQVPSFVIPRETPTEKLRAYAIKDNVAFGQNDWDILFSEWDTDELKSLGFDDEFFRLGGEDANGGGGND